VTRVGEKDRLGLIVMSNPIHIRRPLVAAVVGVASMQHLLSLAERSGNPPSAVPNENTDVLLVA